MSGDDMAVSFMIKGNVYVRGALTQAAWTATWTKNTY
jgi:hypothetical protein